MSPVAAESGFTLIEAVAALTVAAIMLAAIAYAAVTGIHGSTQAQINQQAGDVIESAIESARAQSYDDLVMSTSDPKLSTAKDSRLSSSGCPSGSSLCIAVPKTSGSGSVKEGLVTSSSGGYITNHIQTDTTDTNKVPFTVSEYITSPTDEAGAGYKRLLVYVDWSIYGQTHEREASTFITDTTRGLPLPHFKLNPITATSYTVNPGASVTFGFTVTNLGARDAFDFTSDNEGLGWSYYIDDGDGVLDTTKDAAMTDSDGDGVRDTGEIDPNKSVTVWATRTVPTTASSGTSTVKFTATSVAQPSLGAGVSTQSQSTSVTVSGGVITPTPTSTPSSTPSPTPSSTSSSGSCTMVGTKPTTGTLYYLHNTTDGTAFAGTTTSTSLDPMMFSTTIPTAATLQDYSSDDGKSGSPAGRNLTAATPSFTSTNSKQVAAWQYQVTNVAKKSSATFSGTTYLDVWAEPTSGSASDTVTLQAMVGYGATTGNHQTWTNKTTSTATATGTGCGTWREFVLAIPTTTISASNNDYIEVLLFNAGSTDLRLAYDTTTYTSNVVWQQG